MLSDEKQIENFDLIGNMPETWVMSAEDLLAASRILRIHWERFDHLAMHVGDPIPDEGKIHSVILMLQGLAIECLLKALYLQRGKGKLAENGKYLEIKGAGSHDLVQLADVVGISFNKEQRHLLKRLSIFVTSMGRYPIPKHWRETSIQKLPSGGEAPPTYWVTRRDNQTFDTIKTYLREAIESLKGTSKP